MIYKVKGYFDSWTEKRMRGIAICEELTDKLFQKIIILKRRKEKRD